MKKLNKAQKRFFRVVSLGVFISLLFHGLLFWLIWKNPAWLFPQSLLVVNPLESSVVETKVLSEEEYENIFKKSIQVVETAYSKKQVDDFKKLLLVSEHRNRVEKQMRAALSGSINSTPMAAPPPTPKRSRSQESDIAVQPSGKVEIGEDALKNSLPFGTMDSLDQNIAIGPQTLLNTDEYVYSSFYNRFRYQVYPAWDPRVRKVLQKKPLLTKDTFVTATNFLLGQDGLVKKVIILKSSGVEDFDEAAVAALYDLPAVKNPPAALLNKDGLYEIKLQFIVELRRQNFSVLFQPPDPPRHF